MEFKSSLPTLTTNIFQIHFGGFLFIQNTVTPDRKPEICGFFQKQKNTTIYRMLEHTHALTRLNLRKLWPKPFLWSVLKVSWQGWYQRWPCRGRSLLSPKKITQLTHLPSFAGCFTRMNILSLMDRSRCIIAEPETKHDILAQSVMRRHIGWAEVNVHSTQCVHHHNHHNHSFWIWNEIIL